MHNHRLRNGRRTFANRLALGLALIGPGLLVMLGDNDGGGVITYAQTGATYGLSLFSPFGDDTVVRAIGQNLSQGAMVVFALGLLEAGLIAAIVITASTAWAIGEALDVPRWVNASPRRAVYFYAPAVLCTAIAAGTLMLPYVPISFLNLTVQVIATVFMPAAMLFLLMLLNDHELVGEHVNSPLRNALSIGVMVLLGATACTAFRPCSPIRCEGGVMTFRDKFSDEIRHSLKGFDEPTAGPVRPRRWRQPDDD
jgi:Mn2+/Fe2+ NRAMP family transporter